jgi:pyridoxamine 5'-phosphate oxidase
MDSDAAVSSDPFVWFRESFARAQAAETFDASRAALATVDGAGQPHVRFVLVKQADERGFVFYTNLGTARARELSTHPPPALAFHWSSIAEQVRVEGVIERVSDAEADAYFATRPRGSQLAAWASRQSTPIENRVALEARYDEVERSFAAAAEVPRPPYWGGYRLRPLRIEFWLDRDRRLHDRFAFTRDAKSWRRERLQP